MRVGSPSAAVDGWQPESQSRVKSDGHRAIHNVDVTLAQSRARDDTKRRPKARRRHSVSSPGVVSKQDGEHVIHLLVETGYRTGHLLILFVVEDSWGIGRDQIGVRSGFNGTYPSRAVAFCIYAYYRYSDSDLNTTGRESCSYYSELPLAPEDLRIVAARAVPSLPTTRGLPGRVAPTTDKQKRTVRQLKTPCCGGIPEPTMVLHQASQAMSVASFC